MTDAQTRKAMLLDFLQDLLDLRSATPNDLANTTHRKNLTALVEKYDRLIEIENAAIKVDALPSLHTHTGAQQ